MTIRNIITISARRASSGTTSPSPTATWCWATLPGADGLKTGHTDAAGYGITISAKRGNQRLILVLNGLRYPQYHNDYFPNIKRAEEAGAGDGHGVPRIPLTIRCSPGQSGGRPVPVVKGGAQPTVPVTRGASRWPSPCRWIPMPA